MCNQNPILCGGFLKTGKLAARHEIRGEMTKLWISVPFIEIFA